ncbi:MAG: response regulator [Lachnospiraceae bacterium]|nr:response regulator [Lachnospiraceae bacterium]
MKSDKKSDKNKKNKVYRSETGVLLRTFAVFFAVASIWVGYMLVRETRNISDYNKQLIDLQDDHIDYIQVARYLRLGSDILTENARNYAVTGDYDYLLKYFKEIYEDRHREKGMALLEELYPLAEANTKMAKAKNESDDLMSSEIHALALVTLAQGFYDRDLPEEILYYEFEPYEESSGSEEKMEMARNILFNSAYQKSKQKIFDNTDEFVDEEIKYLNERYAVIAGYLDTSLNYQTIFTYEFSLLLLATILMFVKQHNMSARRGKELLKLNARLTEQKEELAEAEKMTREANNAKNIFLARMSDAIRTPVNKIIGMADIASRNVDDPKRTVNFLEQIDSTAQILLELINDVLTLGRSENGMVKIQNGPINMLNFIENCSNIIAGQIGEAGLIFIKDVGLILHPNIVSDELHLRQVILNIVEHSIKFTQKGGRITFSVFEEIEQDKDDRTTYCFVIEDTGVGMSEQYLSHLFESFSHEDADVEDDGSLGIGMSITKRYVELMGGKIEVESELQRGSKFTVTMPFEIYKTSTEPLKGDEDLKLSGSRILVADDDEVSMEIARTTLVNEGAEVIAAENGLVALTLFKSSAENSIDAILMDVAMPVLDGISVTKEIRSMTRSDAQTVPVIALIAGNDEEDIGRLFEAGMNDYLSKPVDITMLVKTLMGAMRRNTNELAERLEKALRDANTDGLTGVKNMNAFELSCGRIDVEIESGEDVHFAIVVCDVNGLKETNDNIGHDEGNKLLINSCRLICHTFAHSPVFRIGGDEFTAILRNDDYDNRETLVSGLMQQMTAENYKPMDVMNVSFAVGMAEYDPATDSNCNDVFKRADAFMYEHKKTIKGEENVR